MAVVKNPGRETPAPSDFPALASIHGGWQNRLMLAMFIVVMGGVLLCIVALPFAFVFGDDHWDVSYAESPVAAIAFLIVYFGVFGALFAWLLKYMARAKQLVHDALLVDGTGLNFLRRGRVVKQIAYADLLPSPTPGEADLTLESKRYSTGRGGRVTKYFIDVHSRAANGDVQRHLLDFRGTRLGYSHFSNRHELIATFLRGVSKFRPDLRIAPTVLLHYYIDPATGRYDRGQRIIEEIISTALLVLLIAGVYAWVSYSNA